MKTEKKSESWGEGGIKITNLRDGEDDENVEPKALERPDVVGGDGTWVPHEFTTANHE